MVINVSTDLGRYFIEDFSVDELPKNIAEAEQFAKKADLSGMTVKLCFTELDTENTLPNKVVVAGFMDVSNSPNLLKDVQRDISKAMKETTSDIRRLMYTYANELLKAKIEYEDKYGDEPTSLIRN